MKKTTTFFSLICCFVMTCNVFAQSLSPMPDHVGQNTMPPYAQERTTHWLTWASNTNIYHMIGFNSTTQYYAMQRFAASDLANYNGMQLTKVSFLPSSVEEEPTSATYTVVVYTGGSYGGSYLYNSPGTLRCSQVVNDITFGTWKTVDLNTPVIIDASQELWIGIYVVSYAGYAMSHDDATVVNGKGNLMGFDGDWGTADEFLSSTDIHNWNIAGAVSDGGNEQYIDLQVKFINNGISQTEITSLNVPAGSPMRPVVVVRNDNSYQADLDYTDTVFLRGYMDNVPVSTHTLTDFLTSGHGVWMNVTEMTREQVFEGGYCGTTHTFCYEVSPTAGWNDADLTNNRACITVTFGNYDQLYTITVLNTDNTISPAGAVAAFPGENKRFVITPPEGMVIHQVLADGADVTEDVHTMFGIGKTYTFQNVQADHTLQATYQEGSGIETPTLLQLSVYPNPTTGTLHVAGAELIREYRIYDLSGRNVLTLNGMVSELNVSVLADGTYLLEARSDNGIAKTMFVKQ